MTDDVIDVAGTEIEVSDGGNAGLGQAIDVVGALLRPAASVEEVKEAMGQYVALCDALLNDDDYQNIGGRRFRKKSAWRKLAVAYGVSVELLSKDYATDDDGRVVKAEVLVKATAPNGRTMDGLGICSVTERSFSKPEHDIPATAMTRATNRACADLFGLGEVSAEEVSGSSLDEDMAPSEPLAAADAVHALAGRLKTVSEASGGYPQEWITRVLPSYKSLLGMAAGGVAMMREVDYDLARDVVTRAEIAAEDDSPFEPPSDEESAAKRAERSEAERADRVARDVCVACDGKFTTSPGSKGLRSETEPARHENCASF